MLPSIGNILDSIRIQSNNTRLKYNYCRLWHTSTRKWTGKGTSIGGSRDINGEHISYQVVFLCLCFGNTEHKDNKCACDDLNTVLAHCCIRNHALIDKVYSFPIHVLYKYYRRLPVNTIRKLVANTTNFTLNVYVYQTIVCGCHH